MAKHYYREGILFPNLVSQITKATEISYDKNIRLKVIRGAISPYDERICTVWNTPFPFYKRIQTFPLYTVLTCFVVFISNQYQY